MPRSWLITWQNCRLFAEQSNREALITILAGAVYLAIGIRGALDLWQLIGAVVLSLIHI